MSSFPVVKSLTRLKTMDSSTFHSHPEREGGDCCVSCLGEEGTEDCGEEGRLLRRRGDIIPSSSSPLPVSLVAPCPKSVPSPTLPKESTGWSPDD